MSQLWRDTSAPISIGNDEVNTFRLNFISAVQVEKELCKERKKERKNKISQQQEQQQQQKKQRTQFRQFSNLSWERSCHR